MAEKSKEKKRSGNGTLVAMAIAVVVGGTALWSINRSVSDPEFAGSGTFSAPPQAATDQRTATEPRTEANLAVAPPPEADVPADLYRVPPLAQSGGSLVGSLRAPTMEPGSLFAESPAVEVDPDAQMSEPQETAAATPMTIPETATPETDMAKAEDLAAIVPAFGAATATDTLSPAEDANGQAEEVMIPDSEMAMVSGLTGSSYYIAIGSYVRRSNAQRVRQERQAWKPRIVEATVGGRHFYRLVVGPFAVKDLAAARARMRQAGVIGEWPVRADNATERADLALLN